MFLVLGGAVLLIVASFALYNVDGHVSRGGVLAALFYVGVIGAVLWVVGHARILSGYVVSHTYVDYALLGVGLFLGLTVLWYLILLGGALAELALREEVVGEVVRLRTHAEDRHVAVDPGGVTKVSAWPVEPAVYAGLEEGSTVSAIRGRWFGYVYTVHVTTASSRGNLFADPAGAS